MNDFAQTCKKHAEAKVRSVARTRPKGWRWVCLSCKRDIAAKYRANGANRARLCMKQREYEKLKRSANFEWRASENARIRDYKRKLRADLEYREIINARERARRAPRRLDPIR